MSVKIMPRAIVCEDSYLSGDVTISPGCVVQTNARIIAQAGPIVIGHNCIVEEYATIVNKRSDESFDEPPMIIGDNNIFEVGCTIEARNIGNNNIFECRSYVSSRTVILDGCVIGVKCSVDSNKPLEAVAIYGNNNLHKYFIERQTVQQLESLRKIMPNYHRIKKVLELKIMRS